MVGRARGNVVAVSLSPRHGFAKTPRPDITLLEGLGVEGDAHAGKTVQHLYRVKRNPEAANLAQVHFLPIELFDEMAQQGFALRPGMMGENILTQGLDLIAMPTGARFHIGAAIVEISGIRDPCKKIDTVAKGLAKAMVDKASDGTLIRKAGIMGIVISGGSIEPGDTIHVTLPPEPHRPLAVV